MTIKELIEKIEGIESFAIYNKASNKISDGSLKDILKYQNDEIESFKIIKFDKPNEEYFLQCNIYLAYEIESEILTDNITILHNKTTNQYYKVENGTKTQIDEERYNKMKSVKEKLKNKKISNFEICPNCGSESIVRVKCPDGAIYCGDCGYTLKEGKR